MLYYIMKIILSALVIVAVSEIAKRSSVFGALIAALPLTSLLAIVWMKIEQVSADKIADLSFSIFWLVLPSLVFFLLFPFLLQKGLHFWLSFAASGAATIAVYFLLIWVLRSFNITV